MATAELLLHPVRARILRALLAAGGLTTAQLLERLPDIASATMYRHVAALADAGIIEVERETPVRGTVERSYRVAANGALVDADARRAMTKDDHRRAFTVFTGAMLADFDRYLDQEDTEPGREGVLYRQGAVSLDEDDFSAFAAELESLVDRYASTANTDTANTDTANTDTANTEGKRRHLVSFAVMPEALPASGEATSA